jgi:hypothetical protein
LPDVNSVQEYRRKAAQARRLAQATTDRAVREQLEIAAKEYDEMANQLEEGAARGE